MKKIKYFITLIGAILIFLVGCSYPLENEEQKIKVQKRIGNEYKYEEIKEISDSEQVLKVSEILDNIHWEKAKVDMVRPPDYNFKFLLINSETKANVTLYELWISPNKDRVDLINNAESKYAQLDKNKSLTLFEILTDSKLSEQ